MDVFEAIAEPSRRALLDELINGERAAGDLVEALHKLSQPAVSRHLKVLREAGLVHVRVDKQRRMYALRPQALDEVDDWLERYRQVMASQLDALEQHLANKHSQKKGTP